MAVFNEDQLNQIKEILEKSDSCKDNVIDISEKEKVIDLMTDVNMDWLSSALEGLWGMGADANHDGKVTIEEAMSFFKQYEG